MEGPQEESNSLVYLPNILSITTHVLIASIHIVKTILKHEHKQFLFFLN